MSMINFVRWFVDVEPALGSFFSRHFRWMDNNAARFRMKLIDTFVHFDEGSRTTEFTFSQPLPNKTTRKRRKSLKQKNIAQFTFVSYLRIIRSEQQLLKFVAFQLQLLYISLLSLFSSQFNALIECCFGSKLSTWIFNSRKNENSFVTTLELFGMKSKSVCSTIKRKQFWMSNSRVEMNSIELDFHKWTNDQRGREEVLVAAEAKRVSISSRLVWHFPCHQLRSNKSWSLMMMQIAYRFQILSSNEQQKLFLEIFVRSATTKENSNPSGQ